MKLNSKFHGIVDYAVVLFLLLSPTLFSLPSLAANFTYLLGGIHLTLTILTNFELGIIKVIPFKIHGLIELIVSIALVGVAFYLGKVEGSVPQYFYLVFAAAVFATWAVTDYKGKVAAQGTRLK